jgi:hypothetical protein
MNGAFVFVDELVPGIRWDAKYATWDNFTGRPVDGYGANRIVGSKALCAALEDARDEAASLGFGLLLWDGYRPQRAVDRFLRWSKQPENGRTKLRHYPNSSVDLTLFHLANGELASMGGTTTSWIRSPITGRTASRRWKRETARSFALSWRPAAFEHTSANGGITHSKTNRIRTPTSIFPSHRQTAREIDGMTR